MASLPPDTIQVKRKRGSDDDGIDFLRFEETKRSRSDDGGGWVYQRKQIAANRQRHATESSNPTAEVPVIQPTKDGEEGRPIKRPQKPARGHARNNTTLQGAAKDTAKATAPRSTPGTRPATPVPAPASPAPASHLATTERTRRFHLARSNSPQPPAGVSKRRALPAVFIERGAKKQRETLKSIIQQERNATPAGSPSPPEPASSPEADNSRNNKNPIVAREPSPIKYKRPGNRACTRASDEKPTLPPSMRSRSESTDMNALALVMDSWTIDEITKNLNRMDVRSTTSKSSPARSRFKPKAPKLRYFERHPESVRGRKVEQSNPPGAAAMDVDTAMSTGMADTTDEEDYVVETYERVPAERLRNQAVPAHRVGLLVFDTEPDKAEFFYGNESDSEDEFPEDDEDENAENYYAADYPDEDLDWDDEFGQNPYQFTNQNDSDKEEYDELDYDDDDVWNGSRPPGIGFRAG
ncbi:uncharacterized protein C8A04DRAFT_34568 [Dichotomopilus funicola]|uniref:Transcription factor Iwr1 domain-containing protein n=1 Tax=Dichotomopilus funicola TaxID=1934379 RepID=A0AAN6ZPK9_9PEZI|nr:hypothetical protein C8A04DRAFT_34568 [Dichotomopilus funicola]